MQYYNNANMPQINSLKDQIQLIHNKNNIFNNQGYLRENINQNLYGYINNTNQINEYNLNDRINSQLFGFDVLIDENLKVWVLETNSIL